MKFVTDVRWLDSNIQDRKIKDVIMAEDYVDRVFVPENLPEEMSFRNLLSMAMDLMNLSEPYTRL
jgi:hypothetical protein